MTLLTVTVLRKAEGWTVIGAKGRARHRDPEHVMTFEKVARYYLWNQHGIPWLDTENVRRINGCEPGVEDRDTALMLFERSAA